MNVDLRRLLFLTKDFLSIIIVDFIERKLRRKKDHIQLVRSTIQWTDTNSFNDEDQIQKKRTHYSSFSIPLIIDIQQGSKHGCFNHC